jgi:3-oxoacyl-[acyl-carrier protein] reductase
MFEISGQTAIVTGGAAGIGEAIAIRLGRAGARVAIADLDLAGARRVAERIGQNSFAILTDVGKPESIRQTVAHVLEETGQIDILVNNAGIAGTAAPLWEQTSQEWERALTVNLSSVFYFCQAVIPHMRERGYGRVVNVASIAGKEGNPCMIPYSATKAGVIGLTKALGKEVATEGICVNAVSPAVVQTSMLDQLTAEQIGYMTERIPMRRTGTPEEIASVVHFLSSTDCSFVTGQCYDASGGRATY